MAETKALKLYPIGIQTFERIGGRPHGHWNILPTDIPSENENLQTDKQAEMINSKNN